MTTATSFKRRIEELPAIDIHSRVFNADAKVRVQFPSGTRFYYPDASVVCQPNRPEDTFNDAPVVIIEVPSESTRRTDEHEKREAHVAIDSLLVYVLLEQDSAAAVVYRRGAMGFVREVWLGREATIPLAEVGCELRLCDAYDNVILASWHCLVNRALPRARNRFLSSPPQDGLQQGRQRP
jgi:Uma2 family endonuclease